MAGLEAVLRISAVEGTAPVLAEIKKKIEGLEKTTSQMDKFVASVGRVTRATDPLAGSLLSTEKALASQRNEIGSVVGMLDRLIAPTERAASAQRTLARSVETATGGFAKQAAAVRSAGAHGGGGGLRLRCAPLRRCRGRSKAAYQGKGEGAQSRHRPKRSNTQESVEIAGRQGQRCRGDAKRKGAVETLRRRRQSLWDGCRNDPHCDHVKQRKCEAVQRLHPDECRHPDRHPHDDPTKDAGRRR